MSHLHMYRDLSDCSLEGYNTIFWCVMLNFLSLDEVTFRSLFGYNEHSQ